MCCRPRRRVSASSRNCTGTSGDGSKVSCCGVSWLVMPQSCAWGCDNRIRSASRRLLASASGARESRVIWVDAHDSDVDTAQFEVVSHRFELPEGALVVEHCVSQIEVYSEPVAEIVYGR